MLLLVHGLPLCHLGVQDLLDEVGAELVSDLLATLRQQCLVAGLPGAHHGGQADISSDDRALTLRLSLCH
eukprot:7269583-Pyramimonas_sp.AAC.1